jgi:hypothetical protein
VSSCASTPRRARRHNALPRPLDPECFKVEHFYESLDADPMTAYSGVGEDIAEDFEARHRRTCKRRQKYIDLR